MTHAKRHDRITVIMSISNTDHLGSRLSDTILFNVFISYILKVFTLSYPILLSYPFVLEAHRLYLFAIVYVAAIENQRPPHDILHNHP